LETGNCTSSWKGR